MSYVLARALSLSLSRLVGGQLVTEHPLALVSPKVDQDFHRTHVDLAFHRPSAAPLRDGRLGCEQYALFDFYGIGKYSRGVERRQGGNYTNMRTHGLFAFLFVHGRGCGLTGVSTSATLAVNFRDIY